MAQNKKKPIKITETILRDAHQSLIATRMTTEQMLPIVDKMDKVGYHSVECWGGATFDASLRFLKEDPWERLRKFRDGFGSGSACWRHDSGQSDRRTCIYFSLPDSFMEASFLIGSFVRSYNIHSH